MSVLRRYVSGSRTKFDAGEISALATSQSGVISRKQLVDARVGSATIDRWIKAARLHRIHPGVYAVGHSALSLRGRLTAALLYGGDLAVFSHTTAAWLWSLIETEPKRIHLTVSGRRSSLADVRVHCSRQLDRATCGDLPVTSVSRTLLDLASMVTPRQLKRALAEAEYRSLLNPARLQSMLGRGRSGSRELRVALNDHLPQLAETLSVLEERFLELCRAAVLPLPEVNAKIAGMRVDAVWREQQVAVELDGGPAHGGVAAMKRDRQRELALRTMGFHVVRYSWDQVVTRAPEVTDDLRRLLKP
jgi:predicted transcriptional regulator of viral defense system